MIRRLDMPNGPGALAVGRTAPRCPCGSQRPESQSPLARCHRHALLSAAPQCQTASRSGVGSPGDARRDGGGARPGRKYTVRGPGPSEGRRSRGAPGGTGGVCGTTGEGQSAALEVRALGSRARCGGMLAVRSPAIRRVPAGRGRAEREQRGSPSASRVPPEADECRPLQEAARD